jgi:copper chaperone CopZ
MGEQIFKIEGFHCDACVKLATMKIKKISDVHDVIVSPEGEAKVCAGRTINVDEISAVLDGLGYTVTIA